MRQTFSNSDNDFGLALECPHCGSHYLHQKKVEVFQRNEDDRSGLHVSVDEKVTTDTNIADNPSPRRQGLTLHFSCEGCPTISSFSIYQHHGSTYMKFTS
ncbi:hypothetical protein MED121_00590 [Marinomonas sp. MED121]|uniref:hypothetical protein n=1 Tax=Marinomonas sp. MED121 TaxID=314277 RepID=UPI00006905B3|nr:hypothetical protein [Marinomonas sp. MED121]EAQ63660.1 hypothetical protein MED121_00590 [Marinomonas sp. MED121]